MGLTVAERPMRCGFGRFDQRVQPRQRERQMRAALVVGHRVDLVDDHGPRSAQHAPRAFSAVSRM